VAGGWVFRYRAAHAGFDALRVIAVPTEQRHVIFLRVEQNRVAGLKPLIGKIQAINCATGSVRLHARYGAILAAAAFIGFNYNPLHIFTLSMPGLGLCVFAE